MSEDSNKAQMVKAARALLVQASAGIEVDSSTQQKLCANLDDLKSSFDDKLEAISESVKVSNENFDSKINTVNQHIIGLKGTMKEVKDLLAVQVKRQKLEFLMSSEHLQQIEGFHYYNAWSEKKHSSRLVSKILRFFYLDCGYNLPERATFKDYESSNKRHNNVAFVKEQELFHIKLVNQLEKLIGHKPRLVDNGEGSFTIFYE